jgi:hypothetical protein
MLEPRPLATLGASTACNRNIFVFTLKDNRDGSYSMGCLIGLYVVEWQNNRYMMNWKIFGRERKWIIEIQSNHIPEETDENHN